MADNIPTNLAATQERVAMAAARSGRGADDCELLVVSKTWPAEKVAEVVAAGHLGLGENKVQEAECKIPQLAGLSAGLRWHLIGHLQRNKVRKALEIGRAHV